MKLSLLNSYNFSVDMSDHEIILRIKQFKKCLSNKNYLLGHKSNFIDFMIIKIFPWNLSNDAENYEIGNYNPF